LNLNNTNKKQLEILIVEDDSIIALLQRHLVEKVTGRKPFLFPNGKEALEHLDQQSEKVKDFLVLLDLNMPVLNGWEFLEICDKRAYKNKVHIAIITSSLFSEDRLKSENFDRMIGYYTKPLKEKDLREIMELKNFPAVTLAKGNK